MSKLYGSITSDTGTTEATRRGNKHMYAHIRGWHIGVAIEVTIDADGTPVLSVYQTEGTTAPNNKTLIKIIKENHK